MLIETLWLTISKTFETFDEFERDIKGSMYDFLEIRNIVFANNDGQEKFG